MKPILQTLPSGGSDFGIHYWLSWLRCPRYAALAQKARDAGILYPPEGATLVGTLVHAFLALYYTRANFRNTNLAAVEFKHADGFALGEEERIEAERLFRAYRATNAETDFGEVLGTEIPLDGEAASAAVGVSPYTARVDLACKMKAAHCKSMMRQYPEVGDLLPGYYLVDHKTDGRRSNLERYIYDLQFTAYQLAWNAVHPEQKVSGLIVNIIYKTKEVGFTRLLVKPPTEIEERVLRDALAFASNIWDTREAARANPIHCFTDYSQCRFFVSGDCSRY